MIVVSAYAAIAANVAPDTPDVSSTVGLAGQRQIAVAVFAGSPSVGGSVDSVLGLDASVESAAPAIAGDIEDVKSVIAAVQPDLPLLSYEVVEVLPVQGSVGADSPGVVAAITEPGTILYFTVSGLLVKALMDGDLAVLPTQSGDLDMDPNDT